jgi:hypothetical protein
LQIHVRDGRVRLYTMNGADWTSRYPLIVAEADWMVPRLSMRKSFVMAKMGFLILSFCMIAPTITLQSPARSIC